jgi:hypothetical protein
MAHADDQEPQEPPRSPVREALRENLKELPKVLAWMIVGLGGLTLFLVLIAAVIAPLNDHDRYILHNYRMAPQWQLVAYPPRSADAPMVVETSLDEPACEARREHYLRKALDSGGVLPDVRCENTHPWATRAEVRLLAFRDWLNTCVNRPHRGDSMPQVQTCSET